MLDGGEVDLSGPFGPATLGAGGDQGMDSIRLRIGPTVLRIVPVLAPLEREDATAVWD